MGEEQLQAKFVSSKHRPRSGDIFHGCGGEAGGDSRKRIEEIRTETEQYKHFVNSAMR
jgi:hypothetical protein